MYTCFSGAVRLVPNHSVSRCLVPTGLCSASARRQLHKGHVGRTLEKLGLPRHTWLKEVDQAPEKSSIRRQKDKYLRDMGHMHGMLQGLFKDQKEVQQAINPIDPQQAIEDAGAKRRQEDVNEALRMYRLLRPDAPPFYDEDSMLGMQAQMNKVLIKEADQSLDSDGNQIVPKKSPLPVVDPFQAYLPVVNQKAFLLALESVVASLADDVETICELVGQADHLPEKNDPLRFKKLMDLLFGAFPLKKDGSDLDEFMDKSWVHLKMFMPDSIARLPDNTVKEWLEGHLRRVRVNQRRTPTDLLFHQNHRVDSQLYSFADDFIFDDDPIPGKLADERNLDFPLENAEEYMQSLLSILAQCPLAKGSESKQPASDGASDNAGVEGMKSGSQKAFDGADIEDVASQFQDFIWDLERVGLRNWLRMDVEELNRFPPKGDAHQLESETSKD